MSAPLANSQDSDTELQNDVPDLSLVEVPAHRAKKPRRSLGDVRNEFLRAGALLLQFELLPSTTDIAAGDVVSAWRHIERFGFLVTADTGCMIAHEQFRPHYGNSKLKLAHICALAFFRGKRINYKEQEGKKDADGWPIDLQISHLCHTSSCCNPEHLVVEPRWKNVKRNFCGWATQVDDDGNKTSVCNCGMEPKCIRKYAPSSVVSNRPLLVYDQERLGKLVRRFTNSEKPGGSSSNHNQEEDDDHQAAAADSVKRSVRVLPADYYAVEDQKKKNKLLRRDREKHHNQQTNKNKARKAAAEAKALKLKGDL